MNKIALILIGLTLGQSIPAAAHAQFADRLVEKAARSHQAQSQNGQQGRPNRPGQDRPGADRPAPNRPDRPAPDRSNRSDSGERSVRSQGERPMVAAPAPRLMSFNQVINQIQRGTPGRLLDATPPQPGSMRPEYRIRWQANSGQRIDFVVDAQSGAIVGRNGG